MLIPFLSPPLEPFPLSLPSDPVRHPKLRRAPPCSDAARGRTRPWSLVQEDRRRHLLHLQQGIDPRASLAEARVSLVRHGHRTSSPDSPSACFLRPPRPLHHTQGEHTLDFPLTPSPLVARFAVATERSSGRREFIAGVASSPPVVTQLVRGMHAFMLFLLGVAARQTVPDSLFQRSAAAATGRRLL